MKESNKIVIGINLGVIVSFLLLITPLGEHPIRQLAYLLFLAFALANLLFAFMSPFKILQGMKSYDIPTVNTFVFSLIVTAGLVVLAFLYVNAFMSVM